MKILRTALVVSSLFVVAACSSTSNTTNSKAMNAKCPVSGAEIASDSPTTTFDGKTIAFCCSKCAAKFEAMPAADKQAKVTGSMPSK